ADRAQARLAKRSSGVRVTREHADRNGARTTRSARGERASVCSLEQRFPVARETARVEQRIVVTRALEEFVMLAQRIGSRSELVQARPIVVERRRNERRQ